MDARERLQRFNREALAAAVLHPTLGVLWEAECTDDGPVAIITIEHMVLGTPMEPPFPRA